MKKFIKKYLQPLRVLCIVAIICMFIFTKANLLNEVIIAVLFIVGGIFLRPQNENDENGNMISESAGQIIDSGQSKLNPIVQTPNGMSTVIDQTKIVAEEVEPLIEADPKDLEFQENAFRTISTANDKFKVEKEKLEQEKNKTINESVASLMNLLESRLPDHLHEKVMEYFCFDNTDLSKYNVPKLFKDGMFTNIGLTILRDLKNFTKEELIQINTAWYPFIHLNREYCYIAIGKPEYVREQLEENLNELFKIRDKIYEENAQELKT